ncbi:hypothetical protein MVLG_06139 [Microbotryum lychnidis-dioicae p1A1 Lamole]|uniref:Uncharacterized protein n=1 Tax=Microbotryum lychnidis-dioicae (strain p1A1 Lamole / MvSl-1064) TaxID=683840 RepID=U5HGC8_USTV1|nr:hypothetical protein MVLG_06139 [Microbotryum lychnidis-dioicae p1A1 Lamole]|eukprot:KDE03377.1 hypothetical protein MVLG_06139 [Microbotryum lychnidis-dioicae p1A1 Lamole]
MFSTSYSRFYRFSSISAFTIATCRSATFCTIEGISFWSIGTRPLLHPGMSPSRICVADDRSEESVRVTLTTTPFSVLLWILKEGWMDLPSHILVKDLESATYWFMLVLGAFWEESTGTGVWSALCLAPMRAQPSLGFLASRLNLWSNYVQDQRKCNQLLEAVRELDPAEGKCDRVESRRDV